MILLNFNDTLNIVTIYVLNIHNFFPPDDITTVKHEGGVRATALHTVTDIAVDKGFDLLSKKYPAAVLAAPIAKKLMKPALNRAHSAINGLWKKGEQDKEGDAKEEAGSEKPDSEKEVAQVDGKEKDKDGEPKKEHKGVLSKLKSFVKKDDDDEKNEEKKGEQVSKKDLKEKDNDDISEGKEDDEEEEDDEDDNNDGEEEEEGENKKKKTKKDSRKKKDKKKKGGILDKIKSFGRHDKEEDSSEEPGKDDSKEKEKRQE